MTDERNHAMFVARERLMRALNVMYWDDIVIDRATEAVDGLAAAVRDCAAAEERAEDVEFKVWDLEDKVVDLEDELRRQRDEHERVMKAIADRKYWRVGILGQCEQTFTMYAGCSHSEAVSTWLRERGRSADPDMMVQVFDARDLFSTVRAKRDEESGEWEWEWV